MTSYPRTSFKNEYRNTEFIHVLENLYVVLTPLGDQNSHTAIEDFFTRDLLDVIVSGKKFNNSNEIDNSKEYGKEIFAKKVIMARKESVDFSGFKVLLNRIVQCIEHYESIK
ncbi:hypothetical protein [Aeromonas allosaccharophila]|uniref:hypothetical protein n=1 Tax=Aeromonas allosaccharophila TaxID=656 RepID=UPI0019550C16|nr:hypothetical protein [Aeromonas allosaccharophila]